MANETKKSGDPTACSPGDLSKAKVKETTFNNTKLNVVKLDWKQTLSEWRGRLENILDITIQL